ncbi:hypothetical protein EV128_11587 [Rhizobium azibense]|nr:hypothetical protein EV128_11587 [Rhizobium azibense]
MNGETAWALYENRLWRVSACIHDHLDEDPDIERLAEIACMSSYHWHKIYRAIYGETLAAPSIGCGCIALRRYRLHGSHCRRDCEAIPLSQSPIP